MILDACVWGDIGDVKSTVILQRIISRNFRHDRYPPSSIRTKFLQSNLMSSECVILKIQWFHEVFLT